jgi:hypothetical protein
MDEEFKIQLIQVCSVKFKHETGWNLYLFSRLLAITDEASRQEVPIFVCTYIRNIPNNSFSGKKCTGLKFNDF